MTGGTHAGRDFFMFRPQRPRARGSSRLRCRSKASGGQMGQKHLFSVSVAALILACVAGWATSATQARNAAPATVQIDPFTMMTGAKPMPTEHFADYSFVFN